jgi:hypothetical protein
VSARIDPEAAALLDAYSPPPPVAPDWSDVLRRTPQARPRRLPRSGVALAVAAAAVLAATWLWPHSRGSVVQQALAAIDGGPVIHGVLQTELGPALVDLRTGTATKFPTTTEVWYDERVGSVEQTRAGGETSERDYLLVRNVPAGAARLSAGSGFWLGSYRAALRSGNVHLVGRGRVRGVAVDWLEGPALPLTDIASGTITQGRQRIAVDRRTFEPVYLELVAGGRRVSAMRVISIGTTTLAGSPLARPPAESPIVMATPAKDTPATTLRVATKTMARTPVVPTRTLAGLRRTWIGQPLYLVGVRMASLHEPAGVVLFYGDTLNFGQPDYQRRYVAISEFPSVDPVFSRKGAGYFPANGRAVRAGNTLTFRHRGLYVEVRASSAALALAGARAVARS